MSESSVFPNKPSLDFFRCGDPRTLNALPGPFRPPALLPFEAKDGNKRIRGGFAQDQVEYFSGQKRIKLQIPCRELSNWRPSRLKNDRTEARRQVPQLRPGGKPSRRSHNLKLLFRDPLPGYDHPGLSDMGPDAPSNSRSCALPQVSESDQIETVIAPLFGPPRVRPSGVTSISWTSKWRGISRMK